MSSLTGFTPKQQQKRIRNPSAHVAPFNPLYRNQITGKVEGQWLLIGKETNKGIWDLIGGRCDRCSNCQLYSTYCRNCEPCLQAARRETMEEIKMDPGILNENNMLNCNGSPVYLFNATGWSTRTINAAINRETRIGSQYYEMSMVDWIRVDGNNHYLMYNSNSRTPIGQFVFIAINEIKKRYGI